MVVWLSERWRPSEVGLRPTCCSRRSYAAAYEVATELALDTELTSEQRDYLNTVKTSADALLSIVNDILDFSKIEARKLDLEPIAFNLKASVEATIKALGVRAEQKHLELVCLVEPEVPVTVLGDPGRLRQIATGSKRLRIFPLARSKAGTVALKFRDGRTDNTPTWTR
jgi:light-regulated signal transduction histidine kinase (bacteriophytochrome)